MNDRLSDGIASIREKLAGLLASWTQGPRMYSLSGTGAVNDLLVERFTLVDKVSEAFSLQINTLTLDANFPIDELWGQPVTLKTALADGSHHTRSGLILDVQQLESDGGFLRLGLSVRPWIELLAQGSHSRAWENKSIIEVIDTVLGDPAYSAVADWRWGESSEDGDAEDIAAFLAKGPNAGVHGLCCQYRETNLHFVQRLLAQHGLGWRVEEAEDAKAGHRVVFFAASARWPENDTSRSALGGQGIRFHASAANSTQEQDAIQSFGSLRQLNPAVTTVLAWNYANKAAVTASVPTHQQFGGAAVQDMASWLESYQPLGAAADTGSCTSEQLHHCATLGQEAHEYRNKTWIGRSGVRSLRAGQQFTLKQSTLDGLLELGHDESSLHFGVSGVYGLGINNLPKELSDRIAASVNANGQANGGFEDPWANSSPDPVAELLASLADDPELAVQAAQTGYANRFEACRIAIPWRPLHIAKPTAMGVQTALVVGPSGNTSPNGADELYIDAMGRVRLQFHWQSSPYADRRDDNVRSCWVRVAQRWAGAGMGHQFLPRIGQEVLVQFLGNDIDRPLCVASLYNGRGEGGIARTPGGLDGATDTSVFSGSSDHTPSGQGNLVSAGNAPAWHGGAPGPAAPDAHAQNNATVLSGVKSKEFGGPGFNQLVFDDTPNELRVQLATTQHASQLNLGHLVHQADNHRGSYRGQGFELRTDAYGAVRASKGLLLTSYGIGEGGPAGDNAPGMALLKQALTQAESFSKAAKTHQATTLASAIGTTQASASALSTERAPLKALLQALSGNVNQASVDSALTDVDSKNIQTRSGTLPHSVDPVVAVTARAGFGLVAGQDIQLSSGDAVSLQAGQDVHMAGGTQLRIHAGQSVGVLAGAVQPGEGAQGKGLTLINARGPVDMQAQAGQAQVAAKGLVNVQSASGELNWAAAKRIVLATAGGASITIGEGSVATQCPGKITVHAASKSFAGGASESYAMPAWPDGELYRGSFVVQDEKTGAVLPYTPYRLVGKGGRTVEGITDQLGRTIKVYSNEPEDLQLLAPEAPVEKKTTLYLFGESAPTELVLDFKEQPAA